MKKSSRRRSTSGAADLTETLRAASSSRRTANKRKPVSVDTYLKIHAGRMQVLYDEEIVVRDNLKFDFSRDPIVTLMGVVKFGNAVVLSVKMIFASRTARKKRLPRY